MRMVRSFALLSGQVGKAATQLMILWTFARLSGAAGAGEFMLAMSAVYPVFLLAELALRNVYQTMRDVPSFRTFFALRTVCAALAAAFVGGLAALIEGFPSASVLVPLLVLRFADSLLDMCYGGMQARVGVVATAKWMWVNNCLTVIAVVVSIALHERPEICLVGSALASILVLFIVGTRTLRRETHDARPTTRADLIRILRAGLALGVAQGVSSLLTYLPAWYLAVAATKDVVGVFAVCQYVITLSNMVFAAVQQTSLSPLRSAFDRDGFPGLRQQGAKVAAEIVGLGVVGALLATALLPMLASKVFGDEFEVGYLEVLPITATVAVLSVDYATTSMQLVLNRYGSRLRVALAGVLTSLIVAAVTFEYASVMTAGCVVLSAVLIRALVGGLYLRQTVREMNDPQLSLASE